MFRGHHRHAFRIVGWTVVGGMLGARRDGARGSAGTTMEEGDSSRTDVEETGLSRRMVRFEIVVAGVIDRRADMLFTGHKD